MAELLKLNVQERTKLGKGPNRRLRTAGMVPGIYYNAKGANLPVQVELVPLEKAYAQVGNSQVFELVIEKDGKTETMPALLWRIRNEPILGFPEHVDFFGVDLDSAIKVSVPFELVGSAPGEKAGGTLQVLRDTVEVVCKPMSIPETITIDISGLEIMDSVHLEDIKFPEGVEPTFEENYAVITVAPKAEESDETEGEEEAAAEEAAEATEE